MILVSRAVRLFAATCCWFWSRSEGGAQQSLGRVEPRAKNPVNAIAEPKPGSMSSQPASICSGGDLGRLVGVRSSERDRCRSGYCSACSVVANLMTGWTRSGKSESESCRAWRCRHQSRGNALNRPGKAGRASHFAQQEVTC